MSAKKYRKLPVEIEAIEWTGHNLREVVTFMEGSAPELSCQKAIDAWDDHVSTVAAMGLKIKTLEGEMHADYGDYIIKGIKGEFYPCKPDIFKATYERAYLPDEIPISEQTENLQCVNTYSDLTFGQAVEAMKGGACLRRKGWNGKGMFVFKQVPANIPADVVEKMTSLPDAVKEKFMKRESGPNYCNQMAIVKPDNSVDSWVPSSSDVFAEDWSII